MSYNDKDVEALHRQQRAAISHRTRVGVIELNHADVRDRLSDYLDGSLSPAEQERIRHHLDACESCRAFGKTLGQVIDVLHDLPRHRLPDETKQRLLDQFKATCGRT